MNVDGSAITPKILHTRCRVYMSSNLLIPTSSAGTPRPHQTPRTRHDCSLQQGMAASLWIEQHPSKTVKRPSFRRPQASKVHGVSCMGADRLLDRNCSVFVELLAPDWAHSPQQLIPEHVFAAISRVSRLMLQ